MSDPRRSIPSVDALLASDPFRSLAERYPRGRLVAHLRRAMDEARGGLRAGADLGDVADPTRWAERVEASLEREDTPSLRPVVNATGVVLHTNLGRAPLPADAITAMGEVARGYSNLEYELEGGARGSRYDHCARLLADLAGSEAALVVNNAAGALVLALNTVARGRGVAVSRGELVEIGGGFRIPDILERSGVRMVEVGSTNRTRLEDYARALEEDDVAAVLKVHRSNFRISGFTEEAGVEALARLAHDAGIPALYDLGSGLFADPARLGLPEEPRAAEGLAAGADVVVVSGDKLFGGPQAGILLGSAAMVADLRANPLCRALRVDKVTLAGLEATARLYRDPEGALATVPALRMIAAGATEIRARAETLAARLGGAPSLDVAVVRTAGAVGGGTYPEVPLDSWALALASPVAPDALASALRGGEPPVVGRVEGDRVLLDLRTVLPEEEEDLVRRVLEAVGQAT